MKTVFLVICCFFTHACNAQRGWGQQNPRANPGWDWEPPSSNTWAQHRISRPHHSHRSSSSSSPHHRSSSSKSHQSKEAHPRHHHPHHEEWGPVFIPVPVPVPVPVPAPTTPPPPPAAVAIGNLQGTAAAGRLQMSTSTSSLVPNNGPISATVTLSGAGGVPIRTTTSSATASGLFPSLAALQSQASSPAAQAAAQVVAAAQAAYNAQAAFQAQAADATRAATQAAYAQQAAEVARNAANTVSNGLGSPLLPLPPF